MTVTAERHDLRERAMSIDVRHPGEASETEPASTDTAPAPTAEEQEADYQKRLGVQLRRVRRGKGMRLQDVEESSDGRFKGVVVGSYERGDRAVSATKLAALAAFYGVSVADLLPDRSPRTSTPRGETLQVDIERLRELDGALETAPLLRLASHVQWLRGDYAGRILSLREDDLRTVAIALGVPAEEMATWLTDRGLITE